jgi:hypothetical protein
MITTFEIISNTIKIYSGSLVMINMNDFEVNKKPAASAISIIIFLDNKGVIIKVMRLSQLCQRKAINHMPRLKWLQPYSVLTETYLTFI